jgi:lysozyme
VTERYPITGIDVSDYQPRVDWTQVARAGHTFAYIKSTEGNGWEAKHFRKHQDGARAAGLLTGAYHFARWDGGLSDVGADARDEAKRFRDFVGELGPGDLPPVLDMEWITGKRLDAKGMARWALAFLEQCEVSFDREDDTGRWPMIYTGPSFWRYCLLPGGELARALTSFPLWIVDYNSKDEPKPMKDAPEWAAVHGKGWTFWQWTGHGRCPGVTKPDGSLADCDLNRFNGTLAQLRSLAGLDSLGSQASEAT